MKSHLKCGAGVGWVSSFYCHWHIQHVSNSNIGLKIEVKIPMLECCSNQGSYTLWERKYGGESDCESGVCAEFCFGKFSWLCLLFSPTTFTLIWSFIAPVSFEANPDTKRLYDDLLSNYNRLIRPVVNNTETLTVWLGLKLSQLIEVNLKNQVMTTNLWVKQVSCSSCKSYFIFPYELSILLFSL